MHETESIRLSTAEIANLWSAYMSNTMSICFYKYALAINKDSDIKTILESGLKASERIVQEITDLLKSTSQPIPIGFNDNDVDLSARPLFEDTFLLNYTYKMSGMGLNTYALATSMLSRSDVFDMFSSWIDEAKALEKSSLELLKSKGIYIRPPFLTVKQDVGYVDNTNYIGNILNQKRPLNYIEIAHLHSNIQSIEMKLHLSLAFSQVCRHKELSKFFYQTKDLSTKHLNKLRAILEENDISAPYTWDSGITDSIDPPFSEKLCLFHLAGVISNKLGQYGTSAALSTRGDIASIYIKFAGQISNLSEDGLKIAIDNNWFERPPQNVTRKELITK